MGYAATLKKVQEQEDAAPQHTGCRAYGCPFPASMSAGGGAPGYCRHHDGVNPVRWPGITEAMQRDYGHLTVEVNQKTGGRPATRYRPVQVEVQS